MVNLRSVNEIILSLIDYFKLVQPDADIKPGTAIRDLFIDAPASQLALLYDELSSVSNQQSLRLVIGSDLDKLAKNFGVIRRQSSPSSGTALLTFSAINAPISINRGNIVTANNGFSFAVSTGISVVPSAINFYRAVATKFSDQLAFAGITDQFAVQVTVTATSSGSVGNIGNFSLNKTNIPGVTNVTNVSPFNGGTDQETDANFRNRILASFSGSSVGTALGYLNVALGTTGVGDAAIIEPGSPLMTRDGTVVKTESDGSKVIVSEGSGGKVDVVILGSNLTENSDSFIYRDKSNNNDPTNIKNNIVLGQIIGDENKTINRKRIDNIKSGQLPQQPVNSILQVTGSISGSNFTSKSVDSLGRVSGNFELLKDSGVYGGSPFGFDTIHWIDNKIIFSEDIIKGQFNGQDNTTFSDVLESTLAQQSISIINENSTVTTDRSIIQLLHTPITNVTRVFNVNTGERYIITNQNLDQTGIFNQTGRIQISGNTLPSASDLLQVDYNWIISYDQYSDYDGLAHTTNPRPSNDSIDWGYSSIITNERILFTEDVGNNFFSGVASHPINTIVAAKSVLEVDAKVQLVSSGLFTNRLSVVINHLVNQPKTVDSITFKNSNTELYSTAQNNGLFITTTEVVGIEIRYVITIILPSDTVAVVGDNVSVIMDSTDIFHSPSAQGSSSGTQITIPTSLIVTASNSIVLLVTYIANISDLFSSATISLPSSRSGNGFILANNNGFNNFSAVDISKRENQIVQKNLSLQFFIELNVPSTDFNLTARNILSVIRLSDNKELWNSSNMGTVSVGGSGNYQLIFSGFNTPAIADRVLIIYYATDVRRFQPFSFNNSIIKTRIDSLSIDPGTGKFTIPLNMVFAQGSGLKFKVIEPNTDGYALFTVTDGYLVVNPDKTGTISSTTVNFSTLPDLTHKKIKISGATNSNNDGIYDILSYNSTTNAIIISEVLNKIVTDQIAIIRVLDGQELWNYSGTIDVVGNKLLIPATNAAAINDSVFVILFNFKNLRKSPTRIVSTTLDQVVNAGTLSINGTTLIKVDSVIFTATNTGLKLNLSEAVRKFLGLSSVVSLPSNIRLARLIKAEKVVTASSTNDEVLKVLTTYDIKNTSIQNNLLFTNDMLSDTSLQNLDFILPNTENNTLNTEIQNIPKIGDKIRVTFYYVIDNDSENLSYTRNGTLYTNKKFVLINKIFISSGFKSSQSTKFTASSFTQPNLGARYKVFYDYLAPKQNERISIRYNYNKLISDVTFNIESSRPINADVLVRAATETLLDLTINVVISDGFKNTSTTVLQNLRDKLISAMTTTAMGNMVDTITLINVAQAVQGIARARILFFNKVGSIGQVLSLQAQDDEFFTPNNIIINTETR